MKYKRFHFTYVLYDTTRNVDIFYTNNFMLLTAVILFFHFTHLLLPLLVQQTTAQQHRKYEKTWQVFLPFFMLTLYIWFIKIIASKWILIFLTAEVKVDE